MQRLHSCDDLPEMHRGSIHYATICRKGVETDFRYVCVFDQETPCGYRMIAKTVGIVLFDTLRRRDTMRRIYASKSSYDLVQSIRPSFILPDAPCEGMNAAFPMRQGFTNHSQEILACENKRCQ